MTHDTLISTTQAAELHGVSRRRIQRLIKDGRIPAAQFVAGVWLLPLGFKILPPPKRRHTPAKLSIG